MDPSTLKRRTATAVTWMVIATSWGSLASFAIFAVQARLLDPYVLGVFNLAQIVFQVTATMIASGFMDTVIQRRDLSEDLLNTAFWANLALGILGALVVLVGAELYGSVLAVPEVAAPLRWLALCLPLEVLSSIHLALCLRNFDHRVVAIRTFASTLIGGGLAIGAAYYGFGIWSLVLQVWATSSVNSVLAWRAADWTPQMRFSQRHFISILPYCSAVLTTKVLWLLLTRIPEIVIARFWGAHDVGVYRMGWRLIELISNSILTPLGSVAMSTFSSLNHDRPQLISAYLRLLNGAALLVFPLIFGCGYLAEEFILVMFGPKWVSSASVVQILALMAIPQVLNCFVGPALSATASIRNLTGIAVAQVTVALVFSLLMAPFGPTAVCAAHVARTYVTLPIQQFALRRSVGVGIRDCLIQIRSPAVATVAMLCVLQATRNAATSVEENAIFTILLPVFIGAVAYITTLLIIDRRLVLHYKNLLHRRVK